MFASIDLDLVCEKTQAYANSTNKKMVVRWNNLEDHWFASVIVGKIKRYPDESPILVFPQRGAHERNDQSV